jgi:hypothetical protein
VCIVHEERNPSGSAQLLQQPSPLAAMTAAFPSIHPPAKGSTAREDPETWPPHPLPKNAVFNYFIILSRKYIK